MGLLEVNVSDSALCLQGQAGWAEAGCSVREDPGWRQGQGGSLQGSTQ